MYLEKKLGTVVKDTKGKKHWICNDCQNKYPTKEQQVGNLH